jgi:hypothetical protein
VGVLGLTAYSKAFTVKPNSKARQGERIKIKNHANPQILMKRMASSEGTNSKVRG